MEPGYPVVYRPVWFFVLLVLGLLVLPISVIPFWQGIVSRIEKQVESNSASFTSVLMSKVEDMAKLFAPMNSTSMSMARILKFSLNTGTMLSFSDIKIKVVPLMFHTISVVPMMSEISYIGSDGLIFSYYFDGNKLVSLYANTSNPSGPSSHKWYRQLVNPDTGSLYGSAVLSQPLFHTHNSTWYQEAFNSPSGYHASFKAGWNGGTNLVLVNTARVTDIGLISIGFPVKSLNKFFSSIDLNGGSLYLIARDGRVLLQGLPNTHLSLTCNRSISFRVLSTQGEAEQLVNISCNSCAGDGESMAPSITYGGLKYVLYCSPLEMLGIEVVYVLAVRENFLKGFIHRGSALVLVLLVALTVLLFVVIFGFLRIVVRATRREMHLAALLVKQTEAAEEAESKRKNKSIALANASHDIRASLACITALIEMCYFEGALSPELKKNLQQMDSCAKDLLGLLNSILDASKIEAGKMLIEEEEFDVMQLLEDVVDMFHPLAMKKGIDVVLDLFDGSILKNSIVRGDRGKLKQILSNLLSNAVKFTPEGHITVRAWAWKPTLDNTTHTDDQIQKAERKRLPWLFFWERDENKDAKAKSMLERKPNSMEFVFEVDDTGKGIPKEKRKSVFESYAQVKETAQGQGGTGLGLGIVQSLVRLMGGDIKIKDKETGERGTCFCFNILLSVSGITNVFPEGFVKEDDTEVLSESVVGPGQGTRTTICTTRPSPRVKGSSLAILLIGDEERRRVSTIFMERLGIKVWVGKEWAELPSILREVQRKLGLSSPSSPRDPDHESQDTESPASQFLLLVIDTSFGPIMELIRFVSEFRGGLQSSSAADCKVVWLDKPSVHQRKVLEEDGKVDASSDVIFSRPFHGTRLIEAVKLFPEFGGPTSVAVRNERGKMKETVAGPAETVVGEKREDGHDKPRLLSGKRVLLVEDSLVLCRFAKSVLLGLGATVDVCENGEEAVTVVSSKLVEQQESLAGGASSSSGLPYSFILMDCEMPIMDGYEATRRIREEEEKYGIRIPIIAATAHSQGAELKMAFEAGMDSYIDKPLKKERLLELLGQMNIA